MRSLSPLASVMRVLAAAGVAACTAPEIAMPTQKQPLAVHGAAYEVLVEEGIGRLDRVPSDWASLQRYCAAPDSLSTSWTLAASAAKVKGFAMRCGKDEDRP